MHYRFQFRALAVIAVAATLAAGCAKDKSDVATQRDSVQRYSDSTIQHFTFRGTPVKIDTAAMTVTIDHEKIEGYMDAMVMPFRVENTALLSRISVGRRMLFTLRVINSTSVITDARAVDSTAQGK